MLLENIHYKMKSGLVYISKLNMDIFDTVLTLDIISERRRTVTSIFK